MSAESNGNPPIDIEKKVTALEELKHHFSRIRSNYSSIRNFPLGDLPVDLQDKEFAHLIEEVQENIDTFIDETLENHIVPILTQLSSLKEELEPILICQVDITSWEKEAIIESINENGSDFWKFQEYFKETPKKQLVEASEEFMTRLIQVSRYWEGSEISSYVPEALPLSKKLISLLKHEDVEVNKGLILKLATTTNESLLGEVLYSLGEELDCRLNKHIEPEPDGGDKHIEDQKAIKAQLQIMQIDEKTTEILLTFWEGLAYEDEKLILDQGYDPLATLLLKKAPIESDISRLAYTLIEAIRGAGIFIE